MIPEALAVPALASAVLGDKFQFERLGTLLLFFNLFFLLLQSNETCTFSMIVVVDRTSKLSPQSFTAFSDLFVRL